jgi:3-methyl-2-oxobutanoate hydroxymethyltransferase
MSASFQVQPPDAPSKGDLETAEHRLGGMRQQARDDKAAQELILDAAALEDAGAFAVVLEGIPDSVAEAVTSKLHIPTIGIGAGPHCDGQVLVSYDMLGLFDSFVPPFAKQHAKVGEVILNSVNNYADDVRRGIFPKSSGREGISSA